MRTVEIATSAKPRVKRKRLSTLLLRRNPEAEDHHVRVKTVTSGKGGGGCVLRRILVIKNSLSGPRRGRGGLEKGPK